MPILAQTNVEEGGVEDINPLVEVEEITPLGEVVFEVLPQNSKITRSGLLLSKRTIKIRIHQLILPIVQMTRVTAVKEMGIGHALAVHQWKWWNNIKHTTPLFI